MRLTSGIDQVRRAVPFLLESSPHNRIAPVPGERLMESRGRSECPSGSGGICTELTSQLTDLPSLPPVPAQSEWGLDQIGRADLVPASAPATVGWQMLAGAGDIAPLQSGPGYIHELLTGVNLAPSQDRECSSFSSEGVVKLFNAHSLSRGVRLKETSTCQ